jgi:predicted nucleic acid-binding protein
LSIYLDTSFLVSLYLSDDHSREARSRIASAPALWLTPLHSAEWEHVIGQHLFRGELSLSEAQRVSARLEEHRSAGLWLSVPIPEDALEVCSKLAREYGPKLWMRTLDTLHVACALELKSERFWTFDDRQAKLAEAQGMKTI